MKIVAECRQTTQQRIGKGTNWDKRIRLLSNSLFFPVGYSQITLYTCNESEGRMKQDKIWREFSALPPELQQQVADFIAFLQLRYSPPRSNKTPKRTPLEKEKFIGMWRDRKDMNDSTAWVRNLRQREW